jgi:hypothetical protein
VPFKKGENWGVPFCPKGHKEKGAWTLQEVHSLFRKGGDSEKHGIEKIISSV